MIEHPDITREFAAAHYDDLLQDAERIRQIRAFEAARPRPSLLKTLFQQFAGMGLLHPHPYRKSDVCYHTKFDY